MSASAADESIRTEVIEENVDTNRSHVGSKSIDGENRRQSNNDESDILQQANMKEPPSDKKFVFKGKLVVVGDIAVGKTSIVSRFIDNKFEKDQRSSIGVAYSTKTITVDQKKTVKLDLWDTAGQERFRSISSLFYRGAGAALMVYDVTNRKSFETVRNFWLKQLRQYAVKNAIIALAGNKSDLDGMRRQVSREEAEAFAEEENIIYYETSAKSGENVFQIFGSIASEVSDCIGFKVIGVEATRNLREINVPKSGCGCVIS
eukprot:GSMAST32.ASY1.ANO1.842.1 assembled CDS